MGKKSLVMIRVPKALCFYSDWFLCQWSRYLLAPTVYQEPVCPVLEQGTKKIRHNIYVKTCPPVGQRMVCCPMEGLGKLSVLKRV